MNVDKLPDPEILNKLFSDLMDLKTEVFLGTPLDPLKEKEPMAIATYEIEEEKITALCICDIAASNKMGSALTMIPVDIANKSISAHEITKDILDNVQEVMNVVAGFLNATNLAHFKLKNVVSTPTDLTDEITEVIRDPTLRLDLDVELQNYGKGQMSILLGDMPGFTDA